MPYNARRNKGSLYNLYLHYCYLLGSLPGHNQPPNPNRVHYLLRDDLIKLDRITEETRLLSGKKIRTAGQLVSYERNLQHGMEHLISRRAELRNVMRRKGTGTDEKEAYKRETAEISEALRKLRREVRLCESIKARSGVMKEKIEKVLADEKRKEVGKHESRR